MIRNLHRNELLNSIELSQYAFRYSLTPEETERRMTATDLNTVYGAFGEDDHLLAKYHLLPFDAYFSGKAVKMGGLAGVATWPENRRKGLVRKLLSHALETMNQSGIYLSMLHPFSVAFYRSFGWEMTCDYKKYNIHKSQFPPFEKVAGKMGRHAFDDWGMLNSIYEKFAIRYNGTLKRTEDWWKDKIVNNKQIAVYRDSKRDALGYIVYSIKEDVMEIKEFIFLNKEGFNGLWNFIGNHDSMIENVTIVVPPDDEMGFYLGDTKIHQEQHSYFMGRIVNVLEALKDYPFTFKGNGTLFLHVKDSFAPWNEGTYSISFQEGEQEITFFPAKNGNSSCTVTPQRGVSLNIQELTAILFNYKSPDQLYRFGRISGKEEDINLLQAVLQTQTPYIYDFF
ncbi:GNAT family N-acetyltransferase [Fictibacillus fluitans]|uniref:GNAT family N-acetyltransferase n=1 Tax=Fictibacillus fluitans TaxID=3058422 RepID=A0ABT8HS04_9BACL|nr:GNAT family N-acetyltransferase [Fictibacillus sp. NE201]MDN4523552.1 GNAT family N-acetyltransferase [Fictibacillus sp. NE201]